MASVIVSKKMVEKMMSLSDFYDCVCAERGRLMQQGKDPCKGLKGEKLKAAMMAEAKKRKAHANA